MTTIFKAATSPIQENKKKHRFIHSPSLTTMSTWIFLSAQFFDALRILPLKNSILA
jgi:hypothetical protein